jgi:hypothetical protein
MERTFKGLKIEVFYPPTPQMGGLYFCKIFKVPHMEDLGGSLIYPRNNDKFASESINPEHRWLFNVEL